MVRMRVWKEFAILKEAKDTSKLPDLIAAADVPKMQQLLSEVAHIITSDYTLFLISGAVELLVIQL
jgi:hypothetical protein